MIDVPTPSDHRRMAVEHARAVSALDAAYFIVDSNRNTRREEPITLEEVVSGVSPSEAESLKRKANPLRAYFGEKHWTGRQRGEIYKEMHDRHPGFAHSSCDLALYRGIITMR